MAFFSMMMRLDRRWLYLFVALVAVIPLLVDFTLPVPIGEEVQALYDRVESLEKGDIVMVSFDYGPSTAPENDPMADTLIRHCLERDLRVVALALYPIGALSEGIEELERCVGEIDPEAGLLESSVYPGKFYGQDFVYLGYKDGGLATMRQMNENMHVVFPTDFFGTPVTDYPLSTEVKGYADVKFCLSVATGIFGEWWANLVNAQYGLPVAVGCTAVSAPKYFAYYEAGQMFALLGGLKGAAEYERLVRDAYPRVDRETTAQVFYAGKGSNVQAFVYSVITIFIILGNVGFLLERRRKM